MSLPPPAPIKNTYVGTWIASLLLIVAFVFGMLLFPPTFDAVAGPPQASSLVLFIGRFHPIFVHLPAGLLVFLVLIEMLCLRKKMEAKYGDAALLALWMTCAGAVMAVIAGIMLSREGGFAGGSFSLHQSLGIIATAGLLLGLVLRLIGMSTENRALVDGYRALLLVCFMVLSVGAHFGANMVHGSKYLTQYAPEPVAKNIMGMERWMLSFVQDSGPNQSRYVAALRAQGSPSVVPLPPPAEVELEPVAPPMVAVTPPAPPAAGVPVPIPGAEPPLGSTLAGAEGKLVFDHLVLPILEQKCNNCHNEDKSKGDLRLDTYDLVMKGGESEGNVVPGKPDASLLIARISLPEDDDEHMPPEGKPQISTPELALLRWWIEQGASNTMTVKEANLPEETKSLVEELLASPSIMKRPLIQPARMMAGTGWLRQAALIAAGVALTAASPAADDAKGPPPAMIEAVKKVETAGASLLPIASGSPSYRFTALNVAKEFGDAGLDALLPVAESIVSLDLARTQITDAGLAKVAKMTNLKELRLDNTGTTDAGLDHLKGLANLEYLNVYGSKVTDAGIQKLAGLKQLKALYVWQTGVTKAGVAQLRGKLPGAHINNGWSAEDDAKPVAVAAAPTAAKPAAAPAAAAAPAKPGATAAAIDAKTAASLVIYKDIVAPILAAKCTSCHGEEKNKGKLKMHTFADLLKGGSEGAVAVVAGKAADSLIATRMALPLDDDDHMPPEDKDQPSKEEMALLTWWINEGASETLTLDKAKRTAEIDGALAVVLKDKIKPVAAAVPAPAKPAPPAKAPAAGGKLDAAAAAKAVVYADIIAPILAEKCTSCHGEEKNKGKLKMHTFADLKKGGSEGDINLVAGKSADSLMIQRILLAADDDEHMPPEDEPQVTKEELALLKWWIDNGASETETVAAAKKTPEIEGLLAVALTKAPAKAEGTVKVEKPKAKSLTEEEKKKVAEITTKIQALNGTLMPLAQDTEQLRLSVINAADKFGDKELALLEPISAQILWLDLARSQVTDAGLDTIAKMSNLERLHLENTKVSDAGLAKLGQLTALEYLNLYGTKVTDGGIAKLEGAKGLKKLFVWQTGVTKAGAKALEGKVPGLAVNVGLSEAEIAKLTAPPPAPPAAPKAEEKKPEAAKPAPAKTEPAKPAAAKTEPVKPATAAKPEPAKPAPAPDATKKGKGAGKKAKAPAAPSESKAATPAPASNPEAKGK